MLHLICRRPWSSLIFTSHVQSPHFSIVQPYFGALFFHHLYVYKEIEQEVHSFQTNSSLVSPTISYIHLVHVIVFTSFRIFKFIVYIRVHSTSCNPTGFANCIMSRSPHLVLQKSFSAIKKLLCSSFIPQHPGPWQPLIFLPSLLFCFQNHVIGITLYVAFSIGSFHLASCSSGSSLFFCLFVFLCLDPKCPFITVWIYHSPCDFERRLSCFQFWALKNKAAANICVQVFLWTRVFTSFGKTCRSAVAG